MSNGFIYVVDAHFIDKIEKKRKKNPGPKCLWFYVDNLADPALSLLLNSRGNLSNYHVTFYSFYLFYISTIFFFKHNSIYNFSTLFTYYFDKLYTTRLFISSKYNSVKFISASIQTFPGILRRLQEDRMYNFFFAYIGSCKMLFI